MKARFVSLAAYFEATGDTQESLAAQLHISASYMSLLVSGSRQPALDLAINIERLTGVPVAALVVAEGKTA